VDAVEAVQMISDVGGTLGMMQHAPLSDAKPESRQKRARKEEDPNVPKKPDILSLQLETNFEPQEKLSCWKQKVLSDIGVARQLSVKITGLSCSAELVEHLNRAENKLQGVHGELAALERSEAGQPCMHAGLPQHLKTNTLCYCFRRPRMMHA